MKELFEIQQQLKVAKDKQGDKGKFNYRTAADILNAVKPILKELHCVVILTDVIWESEKGTFFLKATASLWNERDKIAEAEGFAELDPHEFTRWNKDAQAWETIPSMSREQATGSASSYARKYALCGLFAIDDSKQDPDSIEKTLYDRIALAKTADDINALLPEVAQASVDDKKAFNAQTAALGLVYDGTKKQYVVKQ